MHCYYYGAHAENSPDSSLRISSVNIIKQNVFRHHALLNCEDYAPHVVMLVEVGEKRQANTRLLQNKLPLQITEGEALYMYTKT